MAQQEILKGGGIISTFFQAYFLGRTNLKLIKKPGKF